MKIRECQVLLSAALEKTVIPAPSSTVLAKTAAGQMEMARAYLSDGMLFSASDDPVNALASCFYAFGWLHFGQEYGSLVVGMDPVPCPFLGHCEKLPPKFTGKLLEKAERYERLLDTARSSVSCAPDPATPAHILAARVLQVAEIYVIRGMHLRKMGQNEDGLACFSYGHGWLDAGVRAGLYTIIAKRDLFTI